jgi:hypothetical protein
LARWKWRAACFSATGGCTGVAIWVAADAGDAGVWAVAGAWWALAVLHPAASAVSKASPAASGTSVNRMEVPFELPGFC